MYNLLDYLGKDTLPQPLVAAFTNWCIWEQARPALIIVLSQAGLSEVSRQLELARTPHMLEKASKNALEAAHQARQKHGPHAFYAGEAASFLMNRLLVSARESDLDAEAVVFFTAQICGWAGFAMTDFKNPAEKTKSEKKGRATLNRKLRALWREYGTATAE